MLGCTNMETTLAQAANEIIVLNKTESNKTLGSEWLGYGYKGYELYAALESITEHTIYDMSQVEVEVSYRDLKPSDLTSYSEKSVAKYNRSRFSKLEVSGGHSLFSATPVINFNGFKKSTDVISLITGIRVIRLYRLTVPKNTPLDTAFSIDLESMDPIDLFKKYGTHVLNSFIVGARYEVSSYLESNSKNEKKVKIALKAVIDKTLGASGQTDGFSIEDEDLIVSRLNKWSYGGEGEKDYNLWLNNLNDNNLAIAEFEKKSLIPLYDLIQNNKSRKAELKSSYDQYLKGYGSLLWSSKLNIMPNDEEIITSEENYPDIDNIFGQIGVMVLEKVGDIVAEILIAKANDLINGQEDEAQNGNVKEITNMLRTYSDISNVINDDTENGAGKIEKINNIIGGADDDVGNPNNGNHTKPINDGHQIKPIKKEKKIKKFLSRIGESLKRHAERSERQEQGILSRNKREKKGQRILPTNKPERKTGRQGRRINKINHRRTRKASNSISKIGRKINKVQKKWK